MAAINGLGILANAFPNHRRGRSDWAVGEFDI